jgi:soluble lytic murein transglycosylase-like protein
MRKTLYISGLVASVIAIAAVPARADVLQIGDDGGASWIAGGSAAVTNTSVSADVSSLAVAGPSASIPVIAGPAVVISGTEAPAKIMKPEIANITSADVQAQAVTIPMTSAGPLLFNARVAQLAAKYDLSPALIEAVVWQESRWRHDAVSPVGARGLAQLMPGTARDLGVNPDDPFANLEGGARYLRQQLDTFGGDLEKALAAYNAGPGRVKQAGGVPQIRETQQYVSSIISRLAIPVRK